MTYTVLSGMYVKPYYTIPLSDIHRQRVV